MNIISRIYCRIFQGVFKAVIPVLPPPNPMVLDLVADIPAVLNKKNINNVFVVTDPDVYKLGLLEKLEEALQKSGIKYTVFSETQPNPTVENVENALGIYKQCGAKALIGVGGGSSIDCAKAVGARLTRPHKTIGQMEGILRILKPTPFTVAVPTTAGTGSEVTVTTVITDEKTKHKFPISDFCLIPNVAVLDPELTKTLPPHITAATGMDALTHAVEAYIGRSAVKSTKKDVLEAAQLIKENLEIAYKDGNNLIARKNMLRAAFLGGRAFSKSYVGYGHAVAHSLGGKYKTPHGLANAVILPHLLEFYGEIIYPKLKDFAIAFGVADENNTNKDAALAFIDEIKRMNKEMGIPENLSGIDRADIAELAAYAAKEANPIYPVPVLMDKHELKKLYYRIMED